MPSPFPGMDPYLEDPAFFGGLRFTMTVYLSEFLNASLSERYFSEIRPRHWVELPHDEFRENFVEIGTLQTTSDWLRPSKC